MATLTQMKCTACQWYDPTLCAAEIQAHLKQVPEWQFFKENGVKRIQREYKFDDFHSALDFTNQVGALAEQEGHHPAIRTEWGRTTVIWWTHKVKGLHQNDFIMAAKTDALY